MSQDQVTARVYIDGGPTVRLQVPYAEINEPHPDGSSTTHRVHQTRDEWKSDLVYRLDQGHALDGMTIEGDLIVIPASRVIDIVFPISRQGAESGMDEDQRNYEAQLNAHGEVDRIVKAYGPEFVDAYLRERGFSGEVVVELHVDEFVGVITSYEDGIYTVEQPGRSIQTPVQGIRSVLCWQWEDVQNGTLDSLTSAGFRAELYRSRRLGA